MKHVKVELTDEITVDLIRASASDEMVVQAAQVSVKGRNNPNTDGKRLIKYLMENRHGSPFEHNMFTFFAEAPLFVFREWQRHRMSSYNEMSGRYTKLVPKFYTPGPHRKLRNIGTSARPEFDEGTYEQKTQVRKSDEVITQAAWNEYEGRIESGIANEIARTVLPVSVYSQMYWTVNARSMMNFLSLRVDSEDSTFRSRPQWEIQVAAEQVENCFAEHMPLTHAAFVANGRIAP